MFPQRKRNRLKSFDYNSHATYFLTICSENKACIFGKVIWEGEYQKPRVQLSEIGRIVEKYIDSSDKITGVQIENYVIMPNHIHILVDVANTTQKGIDKQHAVVPSVVGAIKRLTNREVGRNIFQRSYYDHIITTQREYDNAWDYIDGNPAEWLRDKYHMSTD